MIKKIVLALLILLSLNTQAQRLFDNDKSYDIFHNYTHWGIQLEPLLFFPADYGGTPATGFKSQVGFGYKAGLIYNMSLSNRIGFRFGAMLGQVPAMNTYFTLSASETGENTDYFHKKGAVYSGINYSIPIMFEYRMFMIDRYVLNLSAGIQVEHTGTAMLYDNYKNFYRSYLTSQGAWDIDMVVKAGWYFQFRHALMLQTNLVYKYRFVNQYEGQYVSIPRTSAGTIIQKGDYIGLSFTFHFYRRTRSIEASCRTNQQSQKVRKRQKAADRAKRKAEKRQEKMRKKKAKKMRKKAKKMS